MDNRTAFLDMLAYSEIGSALLAASDNGYNVLVGSTLMHPLIFTSYNAHPNVLNHTLNSTAAGRYQIIHPTYAAFCGKYGFTDFTPSTQDKMALDLIYGRDALQSVDSGDFADAIQKCSAEWASLPGSTSGQHQNSLSDLQAIYISKGGTVNG